MVTSNVLRRVVVGSAVAVTALAAISVMALPASASVAAGFGQLAAAPVANTAPISQVVGSNGGSLVNLNLPCTAPWQQGGVLGSHYNACNTAPTYQQSGWPSMGGPQGFGQVAAAPVHNTAPIYQVVGSNGAPFVNVNMPCTTPWQQGGVLGSHYNACNTAPTYQGDGPQAGDPQDGLGSTAGFGQVAAAPVHNTAPIYQVVGSNGAPFVNVNMPCTAPWNQGGVLGAKYNACNTAPTYQQNGTPSTDGLGSTAGFGQVVAAPVANSAAINQVVGSNGGSLVNLNLPCTAPWQQGGVLGAEYNACSAAPVHQ